MIKAVATGSLTLGQKQKADTLDALANGYKAVGALTIDIVQLIEEVKPVVNQGNKAQIVKAMQT
ncbi:hypothetical protein ABES35_08465 [Bacillus subtilis]|uniref:hypothetical protein n=1 Tax=Bacillus subtilis TaxID=1423 RepID=UPI000FFDFE67|nr:hypothetical protein [Bacillus subtilis]MEC2400918.1 hypothetical protein [Bacillus subtilis]MED4660649.1 hypothetical protein [Bacillus subtilis]MED4666237.1 hypothetical protein [Bacillus subtilis]NCT26200.1 hypothetical protein [Bacillus subtilis subsp. subtilis]QAT56933.1 hypothetical protein EQW70_05955 [Bacillus subtilis]